MIIRNFQKYFKTGFLGIGANFAQKTIGSGFVILSMT